MNPDRSDRVEDLRTEGEGAGELTELETAETDQQEGEDAGEPRSESELVSELQSIVDTLRSELAEREAHLREYIDAHQHAVKEMEDARARMQRDREEELDRARAQIAESMLAVADDLERTYASAATTGNLEAVVKGVTLVHKQVLVRLAEMGVESIQTLGEPFDPNLHEAVALVPVDDPSKDQVVLEEERQGFMFKGKLLRASRVIVGALQD